MLELRATLVHTPALGELEILHDYLLCRPDRRYHSPLDPQCLSSD